MPLQATSGAASYDAFGGGAAAVPNFIEDVFSTYLFTGTETSRSITNDIDLSTKGGLVWIKGKNASYDNNIIDTATGSGLRLRTNSAVLQVAAATGVTSFNTNGFSLGTSPEMNGNTVPYVSWTFRKQPKFFDVVTYTGTGSARTVAHNLGSAPGCIIIKCTNASGYNWIVYHRSLGSTKSLKLQTTDAESTSAVFFNNTDPTSTEFTVNTNSSVNESGNSFVAYLFAHDAGGFGLTGTDNVISCGSFTQPSSGDATITLGYEPQWVLIKRSDATSNWFMYDTMRSMSLTNDAELLANTSAAEGLLGGGYVYPTATGFVSVNGNFSAGNYIYIAIRRGPMKVPTSGTSVFSPVAYSGDGTTGRKLNYGFSPDLALYQQREGNASYMNMFIDRLRGDTRQIQSWTSAAEGGFGNATVGVHLTTGPSKTIDIGVNGSYINASGSTYIMQGFGRAPSFFDEVCYTGTGVDRSIDHNLSVIPEMIIWKDRTNSDPWRVGTNFTSTTWNAILLNETTAGQNLTYGSTRQYTAKPTATQFFVSQYYNASATNYVAYLFATCAGVSKVGSYTGTATTLQIDCGFTGGARFVLIKRTDSTGSWYVWDSSRGIVSGNDPYLLLNNTDAEVTNTDYIDTYSAGFELSSTAPAALNASGGTYIFLAIA